jgi:hypothetical protein
MRGPRCATVMCDGDDGLYYGDCDNGPQRQATHEQELFADAIDFCCFLSCRMIIFDVP